MNKIERRTVQKSQNSNCHEQNENSNCSNKIKTVKVKTATIMNKIKTATVVSKIKTATVDKSQNSNCRQLTNKKTNAPTVITVLQYG